MRRRPCLRKYLEKTEYSKEDKDRNRMRTRSPCTWTEQNVQIPQLEAPSPNGHIEPDNIKQAEPAFGATGAYCSLLCPKQRNHRENVDTHQLDLLWPTPNGFVDSKQWRCRAEQAKLRWLGHNPSLCYLVAATSRLAARGDCHPSQHIMATMENYSSASCAEFKPTL